MFCPAWGCDGSPPKQNSLFDLIVDLLSDPFILVALVVAVLILLSLSFIVFKIISRFIPKMKTALKIILSFAIVALVAFLTIKIFFTGVYSVIPFVNVPVKDITYQVNEELDRDQVNQMEQYLKDYGVDLGNLRITSIGKDVYEGDTEVYLGQLYKGIPVYASGARYHFDDEGNVTHRLIFTHNNINISIKPKITLEKAASLSYSRYPDLGTDLIGVLMVRDKYISTSQDDQKYILIWLIKSASDGYPIVLINASTGDTVSHDTGIRF